MSMQATILAIVGERPTFGLEIKEIFDARTGAMWPLNVGQVYATLSRLEEQGFVALMGPDGPDGQKTYQVTDAGRSQLEAWYSTPAPRKAPLRDETVLKILMADADPDRSPEDVIRTERNGVLRRLQDLTRLKEPEPSEGDLGWQCLLDSLIFQAEARIRWLDTCEQRLSDADRSALPPTSHHAPARSRDDAAITERQSPR